MFVYLGGILIVYSIIAVVCLIILRVNLIKFWDSQVKKIKKLISVAKDILTPVRLAALATRNGGKQINKLTEHLKTKFHLTVKKVIETLESFITGIEHLPKEIQQFVNSSTISLNQTMNTIDQSLKLLMTKTVPETLNVIREISRDIHQPKYWLTQEALDHLVQEESLPQNIADLLVALLHTPFDDELLFSNALGQVLTSDEMTQYGTKIINESLNPEYDTGLTTTVEFARECLVEITGNTLPEMAKTMEEAKNPIGLLTLLLSETTGFLFPLAESVKLYCESYLAVFERMGGIYIPPENLHLEAKGSILGRDITLRVINIDKGDWFEVDLNNVTDNVREIRDRAADSITAIRNGAFNLDILEQLTMASLALNNIASKLNELCDKPNLLPAQIQSIRNQAMNFTMLATTYETTIKDLYMRIPELKKQTEDILKAVIRLSDQILNSTQGILTTIKDFIQWLKDYSLDEEFNDLGSLSDEIIKLADSIDDGQVPDSQNKRDIVQYLTDTFKTMDDALPHRKQVMRIVNGLFGLLVVIHIAFLVAGIVMVM